MKANLNRMLILAGATALSMAAAARAEFLGGVSVTHAQWSDGMNFNEKLGYDFDTTLYTKLEGKLASRKTGLSLGVDVDFDNEVGKANRVLGYVGLRRVFLRAAASDLEGEVTWDNSAQSSIKQPAKLEFNSRYTYLDLVYHTKRLPDLFFGIGYTKYALPTEIKAYMSPDGGNTHFERVGAYDPDYEVSLYNFVFGFDTMASSVLLHSDTKRQPKTGLGFFFATEDRFGIGPSEISAAAIRVLEQNNAPMKVKSNTTTYWLIENDTNMGLKWTFATKGGRQVALGLGYEFAFIIGDAFSGPSASANELVVQPTHGLIRQGPIARLYMSL